ncbi:MAG: hypothetical protein QM771_12230 [Nitrospira sp.]
MESTPTMTSKDPKQYPLLRNLQFSPIKEGEEQFIVLWDPTGLSKERLVLPLNYFFIVQHLDRGAQRAGHRGHLSEALWRIPHAE